MIHRVDGMYHEVPNFHYLRSIQRFTEEISKKNLPTITHDSMYGALCTISVHNFNF